MRHVLTVVRWLHQIALSAWLGGIVVIAVVVAPTAFRHSGLTPLQAGSVVGNSLARMNHLFYASGLLMLLCQWVEASLHRTGSTRRRRLNRMRTTLTLGMLGIALYLDFRLAPGMLKDLITGEKARFAASHDRYGLFTRIELVLALGVAYLSAALSVPWGQRRGETYPSSGSSNS